MPSHAGRTFVSADAMPGDLLPPELHVAPIRPGDDPPGDVHPLAPAMRWFMELPPRARDTLATRLLNPEASMNEIARMLNTGQKANRD